MFTRFFFIIYFSTFFGGYIVLGQKNKNALLKEEIVPASPNAASLGKFLDVPVELYTGIPNISIPITEISAGGYKLPISLSYHASGLKVEEVASRVGAGWALNAGGMITRQVRGRKDEVGNGYFSPNTPFFLNNNLEEQVDYAQLSLWVSDASKTLLDRQITLSRRTIEDFSLGCYDTEPDVFSISVPGLSGKFMFNKQIIPIFFPKQNIKLNKHPFDGSTGGNLPYQWEVVDEQGNIFLFNLAEKSNIVNTSSLALPSICDITGTGNTAFQETSWLLTRITTLSGESLVFSYDFEQTINETMGEREERLFDAHYGENGISMSNDTYFSQITQKSYRLTSIVSSNGQKVEFVSETPRLDLFGGKKLDKINVFYKDNLVKSFKMYHSYFVSNEELHQNIIQNSKPEDYNTLKLDSLQEFNAQNGKLPSYRFSYIKESTNTVDMRPSHKSRSQDHWGYYNGAINGYSMIPGMLEHYVNYTSTDHKVYQFSGADREPNLKYAILGNLGKITYPTGGSAVFEYEMNDFSNQTLGREEYQKISQEKLFVVNQGEGIKYSEPFVIDSKMPTTVVKILSSYSPCNINATGGIPSDCYVVLECLSGSIVGNSLCSGSNTLLLLENISNIYIPSGTYRFKGFVSSNITNQNTSIGVRIGWYNAGDTLINKQGGGLRVKKTILKANENDENPLIKVYSYKQGETNISSGRSSSLIDFYTLQEADDNLYIISGTEPEGPCTGIARTVLLCRTSHPNFIANMLGGGFVGYGEVKIEQISKTQNKKLGKTISNFTIPLYSNSFNMRVSSMPTLPSNVEALEKYGKPIKQEIYKINTNGEYLKQSETITLYDEKYYQSLYAFKIINEMRSVCTKKYAYGVYREKSEWHYPTYTKSIVYDDSQKAQTTEEFMEYDFDTQKIIKKTQKLSNNEQVIQTFKYPKHYSNDVDATILNNNNMVGVPLKEETWKVKNGIQTKIGGKRLKNLTPTGNPQEIWVYENPNLLQLPFGQQDNSGELTNYQNKAVFAYDVKDKLIHQKAEKDVSQSYIWGYLLGLPIAQITNAKNTDVFYTSFEEWGHGDDDEVFAKTGHKSKLNGFTKNLTSLTPGKYKLTYWQRNNNAWILQKNDVFVDTDGSYTINLTGQVDEVRFYPADAVMTTYTYDPLIGMTSSTDANDQTIYYEYDGFGRLKWVKDFKGNILKQNEYFYRQD